MSWKFILAVPCVRIFFLRLNNIPLFAYTTFSLSIHLLMDTRVVSTFRLLWLTLLWTPTLILFWQNRHASFPGVQGGGRASLNPTGQVRMSLVKGVPVVRKCVSVAAASFQQVWGTGSRSGETPRETLNSSVVDVQVQEKGRPEEGNVKGRILITTLLWSLLCFRMAVRTSAATVHASSWNVRGSAVNVVH